MPQSQQPPALPPTKIPASIVAARGGPAGRTGRRGGRSGRARRGGPAGRTGRTGRTKAPPKTSELSVKVDDPSDGAPVVPVAPQGNKPRATHPPAKKPPAKRPPSHYQPLCKDSNVEISYELMSNRTQINRVLCVLRIKNISQQPIDKAQITIENSSNFQIAPGHPTRQPSDPIPLEAPVAPSTTSTLKLPFQYETYTQPQTLNGKFNYNEDQIDFSLDFPCSAFVLPADIEATAFLNILANDAKELMIIPLSAPLKKASSRICGLLRVKIVEEDEEKVSMYGKTIQDHHVACLVRVDKGPEQLAVLLKSNDALLVASLSKEIQDLTW